MALVLEDRVRETTATNGTASFVLGGAVTGFRSFSSVLADGDTTYYVAVSATGSAWEVGLGTYATSTNSVARTSILSSSNSGSIVNFPAGAKYIFIAQPAERAVYVNGTNVAASNGAKVPNSLLANSSITINGNTVSLGGSTTITAAAPYALTIGTGLSGTSYNGSAPITITIDSTVATLSGVQTLTNKTMSTGSTWSGNAVTTAYGGTGLTSYTAGDLPYYASGTALSKLGIGTAGYVLKSTGSAPAWEQVSNLAVTTISFGTTGLTPATATGGDVTVAGTLALANGGTGATTVAGAQTNLQVDPAGTAVAMAIALG